MAQDLFVKAQFTYFQNEEVTCWPSSNKLELRMQMVCQVGSAVLCFKRTKREIASGREVFVGFWGFYPSNLIKLGLQQSRRSSFDKNL
jgi:hypothetical protein